MSARIELSDIRCRLGAFDLGRPSATAGGLNLVVEAGSYCAITGPSGAGKSVLLQLVAGLMRPDMGQVLIGGDDVTNLPPERRPIGMVFQGPALFPHLDVVGNLAYGLRVRKVTVADRKQRVDELIELLQLSPLLDRPVASLSGGEARKVALARTLAPSPQVLLLDEPFGGLDRAAQAALRPELRKLHRELGLTVLHVTHNPRDIEELSDFCAVVVNGRLAQHGPTAEVLRRPATGLVARLLERTRPDVEARDA